MRYLSSYCLKEGMTLEKTIYDNNGTILLNKGTILTNTYIERILNFDIVGVFVKNDIEDSIKTEISYNIKEKTVKKVKELFINSKNLKELSEAQIEDTVKLVEEIIMSILDSDNLINNLIDLKVYDEYTFIHSTNVAILSIMLGISLGFEKHSLYDLGLGGLLHDIGKVFTPESIIKKPVKLTDSEFEIIKRHPVSGFSYVNNYGIKISPMAKLAILEHHERFDGNGYPFGKQKREISLFGRILAVADVYDALITDRPYKKAILPSDAIEFIMANSGIMFDPDIVKLFISRIAPYPVGTEVKLSNGKNALVLDLFEDACTRPVVRIIEDGKIINLRNEALNVTIVGIVKNELNEMVS